MENYTVVWSPALQAASDKSQQRPAPESPLDAGQVKANPGSTGHVKLPKARHRTTLEDSEITDMRSRWQGEKAQT
jgi:hypothetical protein